MKIRSIALSAVALTAVSAAFAGTPESQRTSQPSGDNSSTLLTEIAASMRDLLRAVTPEISLPALEVKLPTLEPRRR
jgi:hypothetical protein